MILDEIAQATIKRVEEYKAKVPLAELKAKVVKEKSYVYSFERALSGPGMHFICEVKKASPSKGIIAEDFPYVEIAKEYKAAGAAAISVLTEPYYFKGNDNFLTEIRAAVDTPILRKDFVVDEYMIYQAKVLGADAILLICSILSDSQLKEYLELADSLGLSALVEAHDKAEVMMALNAGARIVGVNNRNLKDFTVDINNSIKLRKLVPGDILFVSESGMKCRDDIAALEQNGTNGVLIGETFMRSPDKKAALRELAGR